MGEEETPKQEDPRQQSTSNPSSIITQKNHPESQTIGEKEKGVQTMRRIIKDTEKSHNAFISMVEIKNFKWSQWRCKLVKINEWGTGPDLKEWHLGTCS